MEPKDQDNFLKLAVKGFKSMAKDTASFKNKDLFKLAKKAQQIGSKGFLKFQNWFQKLDKGDKLVLAGEISYYTKQKDSTIEKMLKFKFESTEVKEALRQKMIVKPRIDVKSFKEQQEIDMEEAAYVADYFNIIDLLAKDLSDIMKKAFKKNDIETINNIARFAKHRVTTKGQGKGKLYLYTQGTKR